MAQNSRHSTFSEGHGSKGSSGLEQSQNVSKSPSPLAFNPPTSITSPIHNNAADINSSQQPPIGSPMNYPANTRDSPDTLYPSAHQASSNPMSPPGVSMPGHFDHGVPPPPVPMPMPVGPGSIPSGLVPDMELIDSLQRFLNDKVQSLQQTKDSQEMEIRMLRDDLSAATNRVTELLDFSKLCTDKVNVLKRDLEASERQLAEAMSALEDEMGKTKSIPSHPSAIKDQQEHERVVSQLRAQIDELTTSLGQLRSRAANSSQQLKDEEEKRAQLLREISEKDDTILQFEQRVEDLTLDVNYLVIQLDAARSANIENFRVAYDEGLLDFDARSDEDDEPSEVQTNRQANAFAALETEPANNSSSSRSQKKNLSKSEMIKAMDDLREELAEYKEKCNELKPLVNTLEEKTKNFQKLTDKLQSQVEQLGELASQLQAEKEELIDRVGTLSRSASSIDSAKEELATVSARNKGLISIITLFDSKILFPLEDLVPIVNAITGSADSADSDSYVNKLPGDVYKTRIQHLVILLGRLKKVIEIARQKQGHPASVSEPQSKSKDITSSVFQSDGSVKRPFADDDMEREYVRLVNEITDLKSTIHKLQNAFKKSISPAPVKHSQHKRSKNREAYSAILQLYDLKGPITTKMVHELFEKCGFGSELKACTCISPSTVFIRSQNRTPSQFLCGKTHLLLRNASVLTTYIPSGAVVYLPHWQQLIVHNVPIEDIIYGEMLKVFPEPYRAPDVHPVELYLLPGQSVGIDVISSLMTQAFTDATVGTRTLRHAGGPMLFLNPLEVVNHKSHVKVMIFFDDAVDYREALTKGITLPQYRRALKTEPVTGTMKNVMSQAGFLAHVSNAFQVRLPKTKP